MVDNRCMQENGRRRLSCLDPETATHSLAVCDYL